jgi:hypothetical protein
MSNLGKKRLPFSKTVVVEFIVQLADVLSRTVRMKGSCATPILDANGFNNGDTNVGSTPYTITDIKSIVILSSFDPYLVSIRDVAGTQVTLECSGLFVHQGPVAQITVTPISGMSQIRLQYLWS